MSSLDVSGEKKEEEGKTEKKRSHHASVKDRPGDASRIYTRTDRNERAWEKDIRERCERTQQRLVEWCEGRGDEEMAEIIREDGIAMIGGMIALVGQAAWLRAPLTTAMAFVEPFIAFGRLTRVLLGRWRDRRIAAAEEREWEAQQAEQQAEEERIADATRPPTAEPWRLQ